MVVICGAKTARSTAYNHQRGTYDAIVEFSFTSEDRFPRALEDFNWHPLPVEDYVLPSGADLCNGLRARLGLAEAPRVARPTDKPPIAVSEGSAGLGSLSGVLDLLREDPGAAALMAEDIGYPMLARDCWLLAGDPEGALACERPAPVGSKAGLSSQSRLLLTFIVGAPILAADALAVVNPKITPVGRKYGDALLGSMQVALDLEAANGRDLKSEILALPGLEWTGWLVLNATSEGRYVQTIPMPSLVQCNALQELLSPIHRQAENALREDLELPHVGESWVSETELFIAVRTAFGGQTSVEQHGQPDGFGRQHLDVWLPDWRIGIEYQGLQHDKPVAFFGGEDGLEATKKRDKAKRAKCTRLGIKLFEVRPGYDIDELIDAIAEHPATAR